MLRRLTIAASLLVLPATASATKCGVVDFERAVNGTEEGKNAQKRLDTMYSSRKDELERMQTELEAELEDFQARAMILSEDARSEAEKSLMQKQQAFQGKYQQYQGEMQQQYMMMLQDLDTKMRSITSKIAGEGGYDLVVDKAAVVYFSGECRDITTELIQRYNAQ